MYFKVTIHLTWFDVNCNWVSFIFSYQRCDTDTVGHSHDQVSEVKSCLVAGDTPDLLCSHYHDTSRRQTSFSFINCH